MKPFTFGSPALTKGTNLNFKNVTAGGKYTTAKIIPQWTLQSREDLYEQNMQTKVQMNGLKTENRKITTKMHNLENQLAQKDKLFEDMYKVAFSQGLQASSGHRDSQKSLPPTSSSISSH